MKLHHFMLALAAVLVSAATSPVDNSKQSNAENAPSIATANGNAARTSAANHPVLSSSGTLFSSDFVNFTASSDGAGELTRKDEVKHTFQVKVYISDWHPQHVGIINGKYLEREIYGQIGELCPPNGNGDKCVWPEFLQYSKTHKIKHIVYDKKGKYATDADIKLSIEEYSYTYGDRGFGATMIKLALRTIAGTYGIFTTQNANCYTVPLQGTRRTKFCNVPESVFVEFGDIREAGNTEPTVKVQVDLKYSKDQPDQRLECPYTLDYSADWFNRRVKPEIATAVGISPDAIALDTKCMKSGG